MMQQILTKQDITQRTQKYIRSFKTQKRPCWTTKKKLVAIFFYYQNIQLNVGRQGRKNPAMPEYTSVYTTS